MELNQTDPIDDMFNSCHQIDNQTINQFRRFYLIESINELINEIYSSDFN